MAMAAVSMLRQSRAGAFNGTRSKVLTTASYTQPMDFYEGVSCRDMGVLGWASAGLLTLSRGPSLVRGNEGTILLLGLVWR